MTVDPNNTGITPEPAPAAPPPATTEPAPAAAPPEPTARDVALKNAADKARERRVRDQALFSGTDGDAAVEADRAARAKPDGADAEQRQRDAQGRFAPKAGDTVQGAADAPQARKIKVKVNGQEREIDEAEAIRDYELRAASHERFEHARQMLEEARRLKEGGGTDLASRSFVPPGTAKAETGIDAFKVKVKGADGVERETTFGEATAYGTPDEINQATAQLLNAARSERAGGITPEQLEQHLYNRDRANADTRFMAEFVGKNQHVYGDPDYLTLAREHTVALMRQDLAEHVPEYRDLIMNAPPQYIAAKHAEARRTVLPMRTLEDLMTAGRDHVAGKFGLKAPAVAQTQADRLDRKRQTHQPPAPTGARQASVSEQPTRPSLSQTLAKMREARGLPAGAA